MRHFPVFLDLRDRRVLLLGSGPVAEGKAALLTRAGAVLQRSERFAAAQLAGCALALAVGTPEADLLALAAAARSAGIPVNVADRPELCTVIMPAIVDRDPVTVAISTGGAAPVLARLLRERLEAMLAPGYGRLATFTQRLRPALRTRWPDPAQRRRVIERLLSGPVAELVLAGQERAASDAALSLVNGTADGPGIVSLVGAGPGAPDLLTLRAHRLLGEADVVVHTPDVSAAVLDLARRDAERLAMAGPAGESLLGLAREGRRVARLVPGDARRSELVAAELTLLTRAGVACETVPGVG